MKVISSEEIDTALDPKTLADELKAAFQSDIEVPVRHHHDIARPDADATLLLMPAWTGRNAKEAYVGTKIVTIYPANGMKSLPSVMGTYLLIKGDTGEPLASLDGARLTLWRTAAASALAARYLVKPSASRMVMIGAHCAESPISDVALWNYRPERAEHVARELKAQGLPVRAVDNLEAAIREADIVSSATLSNTPLIRGAWLKEGAHLDCVGAFKPSMRETDDVAITRASLFCDTRAGALKEGGDYAQPIAAGLIKASDIKADLFDFARGTHRGRASSQEITMFKSVGTAIEDLAAAMAVWKRVS